MNKLRDQCQKQEETIKEQEGELDSRKQELQKLKDEENALEKEFDTSMKEKEKISVQLQDTQIQISQVRAMVTQLEEIQRQMKDALLVCKAAVEEDNVALVTDYSLAIEPEFRDFKRALLSPEEKAQESKFQTVKDIPESQCQLLAFNHSQSAPSDSFKPPHPAAFDSTQFDHKDAGFDDDDSWHQGNSWNNQTSDPFAASNKPDPFAATNDVPAKDVSRLLMLSFDYLRFDSSQNGKDAFGSDPFAILHAPAQGSSPSHAPESPSPALPPKKAKQPPPRPAPPRPVQGPKGDTMSSSFANFDDFDIKVSLSINSLLHIFRFVLFHVLC